MELGESHPYYWTLHSNAIPYQYRGSPIKQEYLYKDTRCFISGT